MTRRLARSGIVFLLVMCVSVGILGALMAPDGMLRLPAMVAMPLALAAPVIATILDWRRQGPLPPPPVVPVRRRPGAWSVLPRADAAVRAGLRQAGSVVGRIRAGGREGAVDPWILTVLLLAGAALLALGAARSAGPLLMAGGLSLGLAAAVAHDPRLGQVLRLAAWPRLRDGGLPLVCAATILVAIGAIVAVLQVPMRPAPSPTAATLAWLERALSLLAALLLLAPMLVRVVRPLGQGAERPAWPLLAGVLGGGLAWGGGMATWSILGLSDPAPFRDMQRLALAAPVAASLLWLPIGAGASAWFQALTAGEAAAFGWHRLFAASVRAGAGLVGLTLLLCVAALAVHPEMLRGPRFGGPLGLGCIAVASVAWLAALKRIGAMQPMGVVRTLLAWMVLAVLFPVTFGLSGLIAGTGELAVLFVLATMPLAIGSWAFILLAVPRILGRIARGAARG